MRRLVSLTAFCLMLGGVTRVMAAEECPVVVQNALDIAYAQCDEAGRNVACYGNQSITITPRPNVRLAEFANPGDTVPVTALEQIELGSQVDQNEWGIAVLQVQADLPDTNPGQNVMMVLFGTVTVEDAVPPLTDFAVTTLKTTSVRSAPDTEANNIIATIAAGTMLSVRARDESGEWLRLALPENGVTYGEGVTPEPEMVGWIQTAALSFEGDVSLLPVMLPEARDYTPMQAFYFSTGIGDRPCAEAPDSGILIQTPEGSAEIHLNVNGVDIDLGSTVYLQAANSLMRISVIEGSIHVSANGTTRAVPAGASVEIPLTPDGRAPAGEPAVPQVYDDVPLQTLPVNGLPHIITVAPPASVLPDASATYQTTFSYVLVEDCADWDIAERWDYDATLSFADDGAVMNLGAFTYTQAGDGTYTYQETFGTPDNQTIWNYTIRFIGPGAFEGDMVATWNFSTCIPRYVINGTYSPR